MSVRVALVAPDGEIWSGMARMVIAKTLDGDIGILTGHPPVVGVLADASLVRILDVEDGAAADRGELQWRKQQVEIVERSAAHQRCGEADAQRGAQILSQVRRAL